MPTRSLVLPPRHLALAVCVAAVWGVNFVVIDVGLRNFPPLLFSALRFAVAAVPAVFFVGRPRVAWRWVLAVGVVLGVVKFGLLFIGMHAGMPAGLSSLVLQSQAVFTAVFAALMLREKASPRRLLGLAVALAGIVLAAAAEIGSHGGGSAGAFALVIAAAVAWGLSNVLTRKAAPPDMLRWMVWVSAVPPLPLLGLSLLFEGPRADWAAISSISLTGAGAVVYVAWVSTVFGFGAWGYLMRHHEASAVAPFSLLVPVFGMSSAWLLLGEAITLPAAAAAVLVISGIAFASITPRRAGARAAQGARAADADGSARTPHRRRAATPAARSAARG